MLIDNDNRKSLNSLYSTFLQRLSNLGKKEEKKIDLKIRIRERKIVKSRS